MHGSMQIRPKRRGNVPARAASPDRKKHILHDLFSQRRRPRYTLGRPQELRAVRREDYRQRKRVSGAHSLDGELFVVPGGKIEPVRGWGRR
jgi:hypothetical protein